MKYFDSNNQAYLAIKLNGKTLTTEAEGHSQRAPANEILKRIIKLVFTDDWGTINDISPNQFSKLEIIVSRRPIPRNQSEAKDNGWMDKINAPLMSESEFLAQETIWPGVGMAEFLALDETDPDWPRIKQYAIARDKTQFSQSEREALQRIYVAKYRGTKFYQIYHNQLGLPSEANLPKPGA